MFSRKEGVVGYKKRYSDFSPTLEEQGMLLAMGKRGEQLFEENGGRFIFELNLTTLS